MIKDIHNFTLSTDEAVFQSQPHVHRKNTGLFYGDVIRITKSTFIICMHLNINKSVSNRSAIMHKTELRVEPYGVLINL